MYFTHSQFKFNLESLSLISSSFFQKPNRDFFNNALSFYFPEKNYLFTDMGRTAFKIIIEKLKLKNSQILMPAFICDIFWEILKEYKIEPIFLDIDLKTFHMKIDQIREKITEKTKAVLICHTFGLPFNIEKLYFELQTLKPQNLMIIEDCSHAFGAKFKNFFVGNFGNASFFSLYKQFPTIRGGLLIFPKDWKIELYATGFNFRDTFSLLNCFSLFAFLFKKYGREIAPKIIKKEKSLTPVGINKFSLNLFQVFFENLEDFLKKRKEAAKYYQDNLKIMGFETQEGEGNVFCYLSALVPKELREKRDLFVEKLRKEKIFATRIWKDPIIFHPEAREKLKIKLEEFSNTVETAKRIINFPLQNFYTKEDIEKIISKTKKILSTFS